MQEQLLTKNEIERLVDSNMERRLTIDDVKDIIESEKIPGLRGTDKYYGKVRANFFVPFGSESGPAFWTKDGVPLRLLLTTDGLSTHDVVRGHVPFKGQILNGISDYMLDVVKGTLASSQLLSPGPNVIIAENCHMLEFEMVLREFMAKSTTSTSMYVHYMNGEREFCGHPLPEGLRANQKLPYVMDTPSTKAREGGHDVSVAPQHLFDNDIVTPQDYRVILHNCLEAHGMGRTTLRSRGLILVDEKFEIGKNSRGELVFIDEVLTPDASRYWFIDDYEAKFAAGEDPISLSKQFARDMGSKPNPLTEEQVRNIAIRYIEVYQLVTEKRFEPDLRNPKDAVIADANAGLEKLLA